MIQKSQNLGLAVGIFLGAQSILFDCAAMEPPLVEKRPQTADRESVAVLANADARSDQSSIQFVVTDQAITSDETSPIEPTELSEKQAPYSSNLEEKNRKTDPDSEVFVASQDGECDTSEATFAGSVDHNLDGECDSIWVSEGLRNERPWWQGRLLDSCDWWERPPLITASLEVSEYYTNNLYYTRPFWDEPRRDEWVTVWLPSLNYRFEDEDGAFNIGGAGELGRFSTFSTEDYDDFRLYANGTRRLSPRTQTAWGVNGARDHEPRNSIEPSAQIGPVPPVFWWLSSYGALARDYNDNTIKLGFTFDRYDFVESGGFNYDFRDRNMTTLGTRVTHRRSDTAAIFAEGTLDFRDYDLDTLPLLPNRDSRGARASLGYQKRFDESIDTEIYAGILYHEFDFASFDDVVTADFGGDFYWEPITGSTISFAVQRSLEETTLFDTSSYLRTAFILQGQHNISDDFRIYSGSAVDLYDFQGTPREDQLTTFWVGFRKYLGPKVFVGAEAAYEERESNIPVNDYEEARIYCRLGVERDDAYLSKARSVAPTIDHTDIYIGTRGGVSSVMTLLDGERQPGQNGSLTADFGDVGLSGDLLGGIGFDINRWYVGLEGEAGLSNTRWDHSRLPGGRVFSVEQEEIFGGSFLAGRRLSNSALTYGRAGILSSTFHSMYESEGSFSEVTDSLTGFEFGVGTRVPISRQMSIGMEYVHAVYDDYPLAPGSITPDQFGNSDSTARVSLIYNLNANPCPDWTVTSSRFADSYIGLQAGHGSLVSYTTGNRQEGAGGTPSVLNADFGDTGFTGGLLLGRNLFLNRFLLGLEVDTDLAQQEWNHERQPSGRIFSIEKKASAASTLRAGYIVSNAVLLYARAGATGSYFDIDFSNPGGSASSSDWHAGFTYGGGLEMPVTDLMALRFDYTFTDYGTLSLQTQPGLETYDTRESLFRVATVLRL